MGIYEKVGIKDLALNVVNWITWVRLYGFRKGAGISSALRKPKKATFTIPNIGRKPLMLRDNYSDKAIFKQVFLEKQYEFKYFIPINNVSTIIDGGANIGLASIYFANLYPAANIVAVEPEASNFELLKKNTEAYPQVECRNAGIWHTSETLFIGNPEAMAASFSVQAGSGNGAGLPGITIGGIMREKGWSSIDILKLDIEGAEKDIFSAGAEDWLTHTRLLIIELHDNYRPGCTKTVFKTLESYDYTAYFHHENIFIYFNSFLENK